MPKFRYTKKMGKKPKSDHKKLVKVIKEVKAMNVADRCYQVTEFNQQIPPIDNTLVPNSLMPAVYNLGVSAGDSQYQRQGDTIKVSAWKNRFYVATSQGVNVSGAGNTSIKSRVVFFRCKHPNGVPSVAGGTTGFTVADFIDINSTGTTTYDFNKILSPVPSIRQNANIEILYDKIIDHTVNQNWVAGDKSSMDKTHSCYEFNYYPKGSKSKMSFNETNSTTGSATASFVQEGLLGVAIYSDYSSASVQKPVFGLHSQLEFSA